MHDITRVVHDDDEDAALGLLGGDAADGLEDLFGRGRREDGPGDGGRQEALAHEAGKGRLMAGAAAGDEGNGGLGGGGAQGDDLVRGVEGQGRVGVGSGAEGGADQRGRVVGEVFCCALLSLWF